MKKSHQVGIDTDGIGESILPGLQPPIDVEFLGISTKNTRESVVARDVDPDFLSF